MKKIEKETIRKWHIKEIKKETIRKWHTKEIKKETIRKLHTKEIKQRNDKKITYKRNNHLIPMTLQRMRTRRAKSSTAVTTTTLNKSKSNGSSLFMLDSSISRSKVGPTCWSLHKFMSSSNQRLSYLYASEDQNM